MLYFTTLISQPVYSFSHKHQNQSFLQLTAVEVVALATISNSIILLTVQGLPESESQASAHLLVSAAYAWSCRAAAAADGAWTSLGGPSHQAEGDQSPAKGMDDSKHRTFKIMFVLWTESSRSVDLRWERWRVERCVSLCWISPETAETLSLQHLSCCLRAWWRALC